MIVLHFRIYGLIITMCTASFAGATDGYDAAFVAECCEVCVRTCVWSRLYFALH